ncbi:MAG: hypothetical protein D6731_23880 [Planctomycetota bacterium]|nr:MAG: hypothetical protein D6731_23880 [Planctomycetota bacterium]
MTRFAACVCSFALLPALAAAQSGDFAGRFVLAGATDAGASLRVRLEVRRDRAGGFLLLRGARRAGAGEELRWRSAAARLEHGRLLVRYAPVRPGVPSADARGGLVGGLAGRGGGATSASRAPAGTRPGGPATLAAVYRFEEGGGLRETVLNLGAEPWRWSTARGARVGRARPAAAAHRDPHAEHRRLLADLLESVSLEGSLLLGPLGGEAGLGVEGGVRLDVGRVLRALPRFEGRRRDAWTFLGHTALLHLGVGFAFWAGDAAGLDRTWSDFVGRNGGPHLDFAGGRFSWKDGNFGDWVGNGMGHPLVFAAASHYYRALGYGDRAAWLGGLVASSLLEFFWEHYEKTPGASGHDFWLMNLLGLTLGALSAETLGQGRSVGLAVHLGGGRRYRLHSTLMEAYYEDARAGVRHSLLWSPNYSLRRDPRPRAERPFMPYDVGYRFTKLREGVSVGVALDLNGEARTGRDFFRRPVHGVRVEVGLSFDLGRLARALRGR